MSNQVEFSAEFFADNRRRLREIFGGQAPIVLAAHSLMQQTTSQAYPFHQNSNFWYLTGVNEPGFILVMEKDKDYLIAPKINEYQQIFHGESDNSNLLNISGVQDVFDYKTGWRRLNKRLEQAKHVATPKPAPILLEPYGIYTNPAARQLVKQIKEINPEIELLDIRLHLARLRMIKNEAELMALRCAVDHTVKFFSLLSKNLKKYASEADIAVEIDLYFAKNHLQHAYTPIIANGHNATILHYEANNEAIDHRQITLIDAGANYQRYCADISRSYCAEPNKRQRLVHEAVIEVQEYAISLLKPGVLLENYEKQVRLYLGEKLRSLGLIKSINREVMREWYPQLTSHFLGLDAHDSMDYEMPLAPGMVVTVEPAIYIKAESIGVRIEDNILITKDGNENISAKLPKSLC